MWDRIERNTRCSRQQPAALKDSISIPTQKEFIAEFVGMEEKKGQEHDAAIRKNGKKDNP